MVAPRIIIRGAGRASLPRMVDLPAQPRPEDRRHGFVRCADHWLRAALCLRHRPSGPPRSGLAQCHSESTAEWIARQITEAFPWDKAPHYLVRDRDGVYGAAVTRRLRAMGIPDKPIAAGSPWQNGFGERLIGSIRREYTDHIVALGEGHLRRVCDPTHGTTTK